MLQLCDRKGDVAPLGCEETAGPRHRQQGGSVSIHNIHNVFNTQELTAICQGSHYTKERGSCLSSIDNETSCGESGSGNCSSALRISDLSLSIMAIFDCRNCSSDSWILLYHFITFGTVCQDAPPCGWRTGRAAHPRCERQGAAALAAAVRPSASLLASWAPSPVERHSETGRE